MPASNAVRLPTDANAIVAVDHDAQLAACVDPIARETVVRAARRYADLKRDGRDL